jgi:hypothetical protein
MPRCRVPKYDRGDYVKVELAAEKPGTPDEWMWIGVHHCDNNRQLVFATLNPDLELGQELAISYS